MFFAVAPELTIDESWSKKVILQAGKSKTYKIPFIGYPEPKIVWKYDSATDLPTTVKFSADDKEITLALKNVVRSDTGVYELTVSRVNIYLFR